MKGTRNRGYGLMDTLTQYSKTFWWLRGFGSALFLFGLIEGLTSIEPLQWLVPVHAFITSWNIASQWLGNLVGSIPFMPTLSSEIINLILLLSFSIVPATVQMWKERYLNDGIGALGPLLGKLLEEEAQSETIDENRLAPFQTGCLIIVLVPAITIVLWDLLNVKIPFIESFRSEGNRPYIGYKNIGFSIVYSSFLVIFFSIPFVRFCRAHTAYPRGMLHFVIFLITLEAIYFLNLPIIGDALDDFSCSVVAPLPVHCVVE